MKEFITKRERSSNSKILLYTLLTLIVLFIGMQLFILTRVGTQGERVNQVKQEQTRLRIENEIIQAKILNLQSRKEILSSIDNLNMKEAEVVLVNKGLVTAEGVDE